MKKTNSGKHEFALYFPLDTIVSGKEIVIADKELIQRVTTVLRLSVGDNFILFDTASHARCVLERSSTKSITITLLNKEKNKVLAPAIHWFLPLLEREQFEEALYILSALGATTIQPLITQKSRRTWGSKKDYERAERIMIAAAEQSKQFVLPTLKQLDEFSAVTPLPSQAHKIFFDPAGINCFEAITQIQKQPLQEMVCMVGPEADLSLQEKDILKQHHFTFCALTPTILKASHAVTVAMGILRSIK